MFWGMGLPRILLTDAKNKNIKQGKISNPLAYTVLKSNFYLYEKINNIRY